MLIIILNEARLSFQTFLVPRRALVGRVLALPERLFLPLRLFFPSRLFSIGLITLAPFRRLPIRRSGFLVVEDFFVDDLAIVSGR